MIRSLGDKDTEALSKRESVRRFQAIERVARRKIALVDAATTISDLKGPGLHLEALKPPRRGQHSIRINDQYRLCFIWKNRDAFEVEIVDYH